MSVPPSEADAAILGVSFVGRGVELRRLATVFATGPRLVALVGPASVGKSRLAAHFAGSDDGPTFVRFLSLEHDAAAYAEDVQGALDAAAAADPAPLVILDDADGIGELLERGTLVVPASVPVLVTTRDEHVPGADAIELGPIALADVVRFGELSALVNTAVTLHDRGEHGAAKVRLVSAVALADELHQRDLLAFAAALLAANRAADLELAEADAWLSRALAVREPAAHVLAGFVDLARAAKHRAEGLRDLAAYHLALARTRLGAPAPLSDRARHRFEFALHRLRAAADAEAVALAGAPVYRFGDGAAWLQVHDAERVDLTRRAQLRRVLVTLLEARRATPGASLSAQALFERSWPGERVAPASRANRVRVAIAALRALGLRDLVELHEGGYRLAPGAAIAFEP